MNARVGFSFTAYAPARAERRRGHRPRRRRRRRHSHRGVTRARLVARRVRSRAFVAARSGRRAGVPYRPHPPAVGAA